MRVDACTASIIIRHVDSVKKKGEQQAWVLKDLLQCETRKINAFSSQILRRLCARFQSLLQYPYDSPQRPAPATCPIVRIPTLSPTTKRFQINELPRITDCNGDKIDLIGRSSLRSLKPGSLSRTGEGSTTPSDRTVLGVHTAGSRDDYAQQRIFGRRANSRGATMSRSG